MVFYLYSLLPFSSFSSFFAHVVDNGTEISSLVGKELQSARAKFVTTNNKSLHYYIQYLGQ